MSKIPLTLVLGFLVVGWLLAAPLSAQQAQHGASDVPSLVDAASLESQVLDSHRPADAVRSDMRDLLATDEARELADQRGIDLARANAAVATLSDSEVEAAAPLVEKAKEALQQNRTITVSVTTVIIILLLLILLT
ncbi:MAG: hypothetical protein EA422_16055 [Gemmatimonadales bacterium]|nr:MAG: hypothetical protein EA422_16055 [Gemmatimonadales bacterium]